jgi:hypothetical protein
MLPPLVVALLAPLPLALPLALLIELPSYSARVCWVGFSNRGAICDVCYWHNPVDTRIRTRNVDMSAALALTTSIDPSWDSRPAALAR